MALEPEGSTDNEVAREGKIRLSLTDVIYGVVLGYGFNILAERDPSGVTPLLFALVVWIVVSDWSFVHLQYWQKQERYTFWPFVIDLAILLSFALMVRFSLKPTHTYLLLLISIMFVLYALWDFVFGGSLRGRSWIRDYFFDFLGGIAFFVLWLFADTGPLASTLYSVDFRHLPDIDCRGWIVAAFGLYAFFGPHWIGDKLKSLVWP